MGTMTSQITSLTFVYSTVYSGTDQRKHQSSPSLAFVRGIHRWPVNSPHKMASNAENVSIWWRHHELSACHAVHLYITVLCLVVWLSAVLRACFFFLVSLYIHNNCCVFYFIRNVYFMFSYMNIGSNNHGRVLTEEPFCYKRLVINFEIDVQENCSRVMIIPNRLTLNIKMEYQFRLKEIVL